MICLQAIHHNHCFECLPFINVVFLWNWLSKSHGGFAFPWLDAFQSHRKLSRGSSMSDDDCEMASGNNINANAYLNVFSWQTPIWWSKTCLQTFSRGKKTNLGYCQNCICLYLQQKIFTSWFCFFHWIHLIFSLSSSGIKNLTLSWSWK